MVTPASLRRGVSLSFALVLTLAGAARAADPPEPDPQRKAEAKAHLERGAALIDAENLKGALAEFEAAYALVPSPVILHNFGIVYLGLDRKAAAMDAFQRFLDEAPRAPPAAREHAQRAVQLLRSNVAELRVECDVDGAAILLDGRKVAETPQKRPIYLDAGPHDVSVEKAGLTPYREHLQAGGNQQLTVPARLSLPAAPVAEVRETAPPAPARAWQRPAAWTMGAAATVATGVFATWMVVRHSRIKTYNNKPCSTRYMDEGGEGCRGLGDSARSANRWAIASGITAGVLAAGTAVLFLTLPDRGPQVSLDASPAHLGLGLQGRF